MFVPDTVSGTVCGKEKIPLTDRKFERILDAGCGTGMSTAALVSAFGDSEIIGGGLVRRNACESQKKYIAGYIYQAGLLTALI